MRLSEEDNTWSQSHGGDTCNDEAPPPNPPPVSHAIIIVITIAIFLFFIVSLGIVINSFLHSLSSEFQFQSFLIDYHEVKVTNHPDHHEV